MLMFIQCHSKVKTVVYIPINKKNNKEIKQFNKIIKLH